MLEKIVAVLVCTLLTGGLAHADETWNSEVGGTIIWESDVEGVTIFTFDRMLPDQRARLYIPGLMDSIDDRGTYFGYWIDPAGGGCAASLVGIDGLQSDGWGQAVVTFDRKTFPTGWTALMGDCMDPPYFAMRADVP